MSEHTIRIIDGHLSFVWDDALVDLTSVGETAVCRVSHVEPHPSGGWFADMSPVGGPVLMNGPVGFVTRAEALAAERAWLTAEKGL